MTEVNLDLAVQHGLTPEEYEKIKVLIGRNPNFTELGIFSAMWNEHCSYKSSRVWLGTLPTKNDRVIQGPGENAGVIDIDDDDVAIFKIESHNHPSFIEPYQGAATGVGGILRDVFTMGARPIALLNSIHFGSPSHFKTKSLLNGVVSGIGLTAVFIVMLQSWIQDVLGFLVVFSFSGRDLLFCLGIILAGVVIGLIPAFIAYKRSLSEGIKQGV